MMKVTATELPGVVVVEPEVFVDERGYVLETYARHRLAEAGIQVEFVQDNHSHSRGGVLRGLHYQLGGGQAKLIYVVTGRVLDVVVDIRPASPTFGAAARVVLSGERRQLVFIPPCYVHGFFVEEEADIVYKCSDRYRPELERGVIWNDPTLGIAWPTASPLLSPRDAALPRLDQLRPEDLPPYAPG
jgi:dTDP-4-dehydrorhamnose 3,5-epimerase